MACSSEREALMGFGPAHTQLRKKKLSEDERCAMIGNSFHTGVVAGLLRECLLNVLPQVSLVTMEVLSNSLAAGVESGSKGNL